MAVSVNSLFCSQASLLVLCLFCGEAKTEFPIDSYGNILFEDPADTSELDYSTEGRNGFCYISFWYLNLLSYSVIALSKAINLIDTFLVGFPPRVAGFKVPSRTFPSFCCNNGTQNSNNTYFSY